eukprot:2329695-Rhodomonas_salina.2
MCSKLGHAHVSAWITAQYLGLPRASQLPHTVTVWSALLSCGLRVAGRVCVSSTDLGVAVTAFVSSGCQWVGVDKKKVCGVR